MNKTKAIIFDFDGTIVESADAYKKYINPEMFKEYGMASGSDYGYSRELDGLNSKQIVSYLTNKLGINITHEEFKNKWIKTTYKYINQISKIKIGASEFIKFAYDNGIIIGVATSNFKEVITESLMKNNLLNYFKVIIAECDVQKVKPYPDTYLLCAEKLGVEPNECLVFEDSLSGIQAAKKAGMNVFAINDVNSENIDEIKKLADGYINNFYEAFNLIEQKKIG